MKAILVIDEMPNVCENCLLNIDGLCAGTREPIHSIGCPLKPMPEKRENLGTAYSVAHTNGWNACLAEITGETE